MIGCVAPYLVSMCGTVAVGKGWVDLYSCFEGGGYPTYENNYPLALRRAVGDETASAEWPTTWGVEVLMLSPGGV